MIGHFLGAADVAARLGISQSTWRAYVARGQAPPPDLAAYGRNWWDPQTIYAWEREHPGVRKNKP